MGMTEKNILEDKYIERLEKIFEEKKWEIGEKETSYFDIFCKRLAKLKSDKDREFILELTEDYLLVTLEKYEEFLILAIEKFFKEESKNLETVDTIHVCPLIKKDVEKIVNTYKDISEIQEVTDEDFSAIKISKFKIKALRAGINRLKFTIEMQR